MDELNSTYIRLIQNNSILKDKLKSVINLSSKLCIKPIDKPKVITNKVFKPKELRAKSNKPILSKYFQVKERRLKQIKEEILLVSNENNYLSQVVDFYERIPLRENNILDSHILSNLDIFNYCVCIENVLFLLQMYSEYINYQIKFLVNIISSSDKDDISSDYEINNLDSLISSFKERISLINSLNKTISSLESLSQNIPNEYKILLNQAKEDELLQLRELSHLQFLIKQINDSIYELKHKNNKIQHVESLTIGYNNFKQKALKIIKRKSSNNNDDKKYNSIYLSDNIINHEKSIGIKPFDSNIYFKINKL